MDKIKVALELIAISKKLSLADTETDIAKEIKKFAKSLVDNKMCSYSDDEDGECNQKAVMIAYNNAEDVGGDFPPNVYCAKHGDEIASSHNADQTPKCPCCGCMFDA